MHPATLMAYAANLERGMRRDHPLQRALAGPRHIHVSREIVSAAGTQRRNAQYGSDVLAKTFPSNARLPAAVVVFTLEVGKQTGIFVACQREETVFLSHANDDASHISFEPLGTIRTVQCSGRFGDLAGAVVQAIDFALVLSLINTPRLTVAQPAIIGLAAKPSRSAQKRLIPGRPATAWSNVTWRIGSPSAAPGEPGYVEEAHRRPLHWRRGSWVSCAPEHPSAEWVYDGWRYWRRDCWAGHPAYGIKLQRHVPRLGGERGFDVEDVAVLPAHKLAAMTDAQIAALVESGHAPSAARH